MKQLKSRWRRQRTHSTRNGENSDSAASREPARAAGITENSFDGGNDNGEDFKENNRESAGELCQCDDASVCDWDGDEVCTVEDFANVFWDKAVEKILNVLATEE